MGPEAGGGALIPRTGDVAGGREPFSQEAEVEVIPGSAPICAPLQ